MPARASRIGPPSLIAILTALVLAACGSTSSSEAARWKPHPTTAPWQWQLQGKIDTSVPAHVYEVDGFDVGGRVVRRLHRKGRRVICYLDVGSWERYRPDRAAFPKQVIGRKYQGYPDERWLDIRRIDLLAKPLKARFDLCRRKGFDAVEPDNDNGFTSAGFRCRADQLRFNRWWKRVKAGFEAEEPSIGPATSSRASSASTAALPLQAVFEAERATTSSRGPGSPARDEPVQHRRCLGLPHHQGGDCVADIPELDVLLQTEQTFPPPPEFAAQANASDPGIYERAEADPETWWASWAEKLEWIEPWEQILDWSDPPFAKWFVGGKLNACANCLDRHVDAGRGDRVAFHWEAEDADELGEEGRRSITYAELLAETQRFANALKGLGVGKGDVVGIYMPMIPETVMAMLACARIGAIHNVVFGGFSADSVRERMEISEAKLLVTADATLRRGAPVPMKPAVDEILDSLPKMEHVIVVDRCGTEPPMKEGRDIFWKEACAKADPECAPEPMDAEDPLYILYTSGSTAKPKGIVHTTGGYLTQVSATHKLVFDLKEESDVYWCGADVGWVTGHSYIVYGPLANGATSIIYEGAPNYPAEDRWWEIIERYRVTIFYTAPTAIRACMKWGDEYPAAHDLSSLRLLGTGG